MIHTHKQAVLDFFPAACIQFLRGYKVFVVRASRYGNPLGSGLTRGSAWSRAASTVRVAAAQADAKVAPYDALLEEVKALQAQSAQLLQNIEPTMYFLTALNQQRLNWLQQQYSAQPGAPLAPPCREDLGHQKTFGTGDSLESVLYQVPVMGQGLRGSGYTWLVLEAVTHRELAVPGWRELPHNRLEHWFCWSADCQAWALTHRPPELAGVSRGFALD